MLIIIRHNDTFLVLLRGQGGGWAAARHWHVTRSPVSPARSVARAGVSMSTLLWSANAAPPLAA